MDIKNEIKVMVADMLEIETEELKEDDLFSDHEMDSFTAMQLIAMLENEYDITIPDDRIKEMISVNSVAKLVEDLKNE